MTHQPADHGPGHRPREHAGMPHHPRYHGADEDTAAGPARQPRTARQRRVIIAVVVIVALLLAAILIMHLTGAMPKGTGF